MTLAAIIPYHHAKCYVAILDAGGSVLAQAEIEVGYLAPPVGDSRMVRVCGPEEIAKVVARVRALCRGHGVERVNIEEPAWAGVEADRGRAVGDALARALPMVALIPYAGATAEERGDLAARLRPLLPTKSERPDGAYTIEPSPAHADRQRTASSGDEKPTPAPPSPQAPKAGRRIAGIDPGSRHVAVVVVEQTPAGLRYVNSLTPPLGRDVPMTPKVITRKDGGTITKTTRHVVTDEELRDAVRAVVEFLAEHDVDAAAVETAKFAHAGAGALLLRSNRVGGVIEGAILAAGLPVQSVTSREWRARAKKMAGLRVEGIRGVQELKRGGATVDPIVCGDGGEPQHERGKVVHAPHSTAWRDAVLALVAGLPPQPPEAREHVTDAAGCALWGAVPLEEMPKPAPRPKGPGKRRGDSREAARAALREALGCLGEAVCKAGGTWRHVASCPVNVASKARARSKVSAAMKGNQNARKGASE